MVDRSRRRLWIINAALIVLVLVVLAGVVIGLTASSSSSADTSVRTVPVGRGTVTETVTASGTVASAETSTLNFASGGTVAGVSVALGDRVRRGQTVATLDGASARANLTAARAQLTAARQQLSDAIDARDAADDPTPAAAAATPAPTTGGAAAATPAPSASGGAASTGSTGSTGSAGSAGSAGGSDASVDSARASVRQAEAQVVTSRQSTSDLTLEAPQDGTVVTLDARVGQTVGGGGIVTSGGSSATGGSAAGSSGGSSSGGGASGGGASSGSAGGAAGSSGAAAGAAASSGAATGGSSLMTVADLDSLQVQADVPELDVGRVNNGLPATITVNALPGDSIPGSVSSVDVLPGAATGTGSSVQYGTTVGVDQPPSGLRPGMSANVSIVVRSAVDTTFLPSVALTPIGGAGATAATVNVLGRDGQVGSRTVGIGLTSDTTTQITSGLAPGELAVLPDAAAVDPNQFRGGPRTQSGGGG